MTPNLTFIYDRKGQGTTKKAAVVELRITAGRERKYISTGVKVLPKEWKNGAVVGREDWKELNDQLQMLKRKCSEIVTRMMDEGCFDMGAIPGLLKDGVKQKQTFLEYAAEIAERKFKCVSKGTRKRYEVVMRFLDTWRGIVFFSDLTERNVQRMDEELEARGLKRCSRWNYHKMVKIFVKNAIEDGLIKKNPYARAGIMKGDDEGVVRYLTPEEFHRFESCDIPIERLRRVRDLFIFQTYTMMGYSDLATFDYGNCVKVDGQVVYKARRKKTGQEFTIVLLGPALAVLSRHGWRLPMISNVKYNEYLKAAVTYARIDKQVTTHWARHTGATMLLNEGKVPMHVVQHILGHASIRETERTYAKVLDETIVEEMAGFECKVKI